ncbi:Factor arrest protein 11 [Aspergillus nanangensis]|uniref:Factor arrest protein 11 n=1 Tax=Aspergillus nanangensis TaxID=2582783 RepID=A0AAD4CRB9_ASPNN|nr:Factor arrest protein 11 [Aspergillus nanangensis]
MDARPVSADPALEDPHIVRADEVDQTGTDITTVSDDQLMEEVAEGLRQEQVSQSPAVTAEPQSLPPRRPELRRDIAAPPPPLQPPPPAPIQQNLERPPDSLSLAQLRQLVQEMPKVEQPAYAFEYADSQPFAEEIEEWFQYSDFDRSMLLGMRSSFDKTWSSFCGRQKIDAPETWISTTDDLRKKFMTEMINRLDGETFARIEALETICYTVTGAWVMTAGRATDEYLDDVFQGTAADPKFKSLQIHWMETNVDLLQKCSGIHPLYECLNRVFEKSRSSSNLDAENVGLEASQASLAISEREANMVLTAFYLVVEVGRRQEARDASTTPIRDTLMGLSPNPLVLLIDIIARLRWDDSTNVPLTRIILLFWKSLLLFFGGSAMLKKAKEELEPTFEDKEDASRRTPFLTASPLDYHTFRQEITSKYPSYNPPPPVVPLELENSSILPPLPQHPSRAAASSGLFSGVGPSIAGGNGSILQQAVHIATPAPSPPPSPIGPGGKAGKKQNYQTNQNFPFMYPPLDDSSNDLGGKGTTEVQDVLVGKKWEGSDVPASIIEAGKLFSSRVKMTRAMRQLWEERERFMKYDRGWYLDESGAASDDDDVTDGLVQDMHDVNLQEKKPCSAWPSPKETDNEDIQRRLEAVDSFYTEALVHLQSITIVFLKVILTNVSAMVNQVSAQDSQGLSDGYGAVNGFAGPDGSLEFDAAMDELDNVRLREITGKAISGSLLLLVKWFKRSHILKFEYMTQLLLDSNYLPLILKMFAHQDVDQAVAQKNDREELGFFHFCHIHSNQPPEPANSDEDSSEDDAIPPPIARHRPENVPGTSSVRGPSPDEPTPDFTEGPHRPEVDELGYPTAPPPKEPITVFSFRNFFSAINYLHIMQKITREKAHRCLLLVQYKSSTILRKGLKIPDPYLRFYTLKLFKSQVPYCGRKWRQSNMRVITAIYLYCRPELRDDWLAGSDIDAEVEEALPLEQALRGLTHWWHLRRYKDVMGGEEGTSLMEEERDFFVRELEAMGWGFAGEEMLSGGSEDAEMVGAHLTNGTEWEGAPIEAW